MIDVSLEFKVLWNRCAHTDSHKKHQEGFLLFGWCKNHKNDKAAISKWVWFQFIKRTDLFPDMMYSCCLVKSIQCIK